MSDKGTVRDFAHNTTEIAPDTYIAGGLGVVAPKLLEAEDRLLVQHGQQIANLIRQRGCDELLVRRVRNDELIRYGIYIFRDVPG